MLHRVNARTPEDFFVPAVKRAPVGACFIRVTECNDEILDMIWRCHEAAAARGVILDGGLSNPIDLQLRYYRDVLGDAFEANYDFVLSSLQKWVPRTQDRVRRDLATAIMAEIDNLRRSGKSDGIIRNIYIKWMCWLYYSFGRLTPFLGQEDLPKALVFGGEPGVHALTMLKIICSVGTDILMVDNSSGGKYEKLDPGDEISQHLAVPGGKPFPADLTLKKLRAERSARSAPPAAAPRQQIRQPVPSPVPAPMQQLPPLAAQRAASSAAPNAQHRPVQPLPNVAQRASSAPSGTPRTAQHVPMPGAQQHPLQPPQRSVAAGQPHASPAAQRTAPARPFVPQKIDIEDRFPRPARRECCNAWMKNASLDSVLTRPADRGDDAALFYNSFIRLTGVTDRMTYASELHQFYKSLLTAKRTVFVLDGPVPEPDTEEIDSIRRRNYKTPEEMIVDLAGNLPSSSQIELQKEIQSAFVRILRRVSGEEKNLNRLTVKAVYLLCWIRRYQGEIFKGWKETDIPVVIKMGGCVNDSEAMYFMYLSMLPTDVVILSPDLDNPCVLQDERLLEIRGSQSVKNMPFPKNSGNLEMGTVAAFAEQDLTEMLYSDSGLYRTRQFERAEIITLKTTYDEIFLLWDQELKFRPNFSAQDGVVSVPVIYAKISGVKNGKLSPYWQKVRELKEAGDTLFFRSFPIVNPTECGKYQNLASKGLKKGKILREEIRSARDYPFGLLRKEIQEHIFDKVQLMLDRRIIRGTFENGTEYTVLSTVLGVSKDIIRAVQAFDFAKRNPKAVVVSTKDVSPTLEDAILLTFLNEIGFDVVMFVPTGYQLIERFLNDHYPVEHQIGDFVYDLEVPDMNSASPTKALSWLNNLLKRGD